MSEQTYPVVNKDAKGECFVFRKSEQHSIFIVAKEETTTVTICKTEEAFRWYEKLYHTDKVSTIDELNIAWGGMQEELEQMFL